jgi:UrcA family protein
MMNSVTTTAPLSPSKITLLMLVCGIAGGAAIGTASAATADEQVPHMPVYYNPQSLETDRGAQAVYHKIVHAAEEVCPMDDSSPHLMTGAVRTCREQAIARAVHDIHSPKVAALYVANTKHGSSKHG